MRRPAKPAIEREDNQRQISNLTAPERETIVNVSDADDTISIWTAQRPIITKLRKNPAATLVDWGRYGTTIWASFTLPSNCLSFRSAGKAAVRTAHEIGLREALEMTYGDHHGNPEALLAYREGKSGDPSPVAPTDARSSRNQGGGGQ
jgi:hypothetical protein